MKLFPRQNLWAPHVDSRYSEGEKKIAGNFNLKPLATEQIDQSFKIIFSEYTGELKGKQ